MMLTTTPTMTETPSIYIPKFDVCVAPCQILPSSHITMAVYRMPAKTPRIVAMQTTGNASFHRFFMMRLSVYPNALKSCTSPLRCHSISLSGLTNNSNAEMMMKKPNARNRLAKSIPFLAAYNPLSRGWMVCTSNMDSCKPPVVTGWSLTRRAVAVP